MLQLGQSASLTAKLSSKVLLVRASITGLCVHRLFCKCLSVPVLCLLHCVDTLTHHFHNKL